MTPRGKRRLRDALFGAPRDPLAPETRQHIALIAFLAWIGIGADGLSSSSYGPAEAFIALGPHSQLALYLAFATAFTVFVISLAYNQVIELFPERRRRLQGRDQASGARTPAWSRARR